MKKIILGGLILSSLFVGTTNAINFNVNEPTNINGITVECDQNLNCTSTVNDITFNGFKQADGSNFTNYIYWSEYGLTYTQMWTELSRTPRQGVFTTLKQVSYTSGVNTTDAVIDHIPGNYINYDTRIENNGLYAGKLTSITFNPNGSVGGMFCYNYNEELGSICMHYSDTYGRSGVNFLTRSYTFQQFAELGVTVNSPFISSGPNTEGGPISCINIKTEIMLYGNKYNTGMCYTNGLYFSGFTPIQTGKLSIFEVFPSYEDYQNMANRYNTYCHAPYTQEYCNNAMSGYDEGMDFFTYIENANNNSVFTVEAEKLYQYCHLQLNFTEEQKRSECKDTVDNYYATGVSEEGSNGNPFEGITDRLEDNVQIAVPTTGTVFDEFLDGDTRVVGITDRYGNFKEIYHKIMGLFKYRNTQQGIIPGYITAMIMLILLLAIFKK